MRLRRLDLTRYGRFTDQAIDFGERGDGPDLHVVYGPNEAGKSTLFNGFLDLLYGMGAQSRYGFLHPYPTMRVAAELEVEGGSMDVARIKRTANSLLDGTGRILPEAVVAGPLGGISRDAYRAMFSLDDESLEGGGKAILDSRGDLGELLFSASAGLAGLSRKLIEIRAEADGFYRYRAQSGALIELKARLAALKAERETIDMGALEFTRLVDARDAATTRYAGAVTERGALQARYDAVTAALGALPRLGVLRGLRDRIAALAGLPLPPPGWSDEATALSKEQAGLTASIEAADAEIKRLTDEAEALASDPPAQGAVSSLTELARLRPRAETAWQDLPRSRLALRGEDAAVAVLLAKLDRVDVPDPRILLLPVATTAALGVAIEARSGIVASLQAAADAKDLAEAKLAGARRKLAELVGAAAGEDGIDRRAVFEALDAAVTAVRTSDHLPRTLSAERAASRAREDLERRIAALAPFEGGTAALLTRTVPSEETIAAWKLREVALDAECLRIGAEEARLVDEGERIEGERHIASRTGAIISEADLAAVRADREKSWAKHRCALDEATADAFEAAMRRDDVGVDSRIADAAGLARLRQLDDNMARAKIALSSLVRDREREHAQRLRHEDDLADAWRRAGAVAPFSRGAGALEAWLGRRKQVVEAQAKLEEAERQVRDAADDGARLTASLRGALLRAWIGIDPSDGLDVQLARARAALEAEGEARNLRSAVLERLSEAEERREAYDKALRADEVWRSDWAAICSTCWLSEGQGVPTIDAVRSILSELTTLAATLERRAGWADRIAKMERDADAFANRVAGVAGVVGETAEDANALRLADRLAARIGAAVDVATALSRIGAARANAEERRRGLVERVGVVTRRRSEMARFFGIVDANEVEGCLARSAERNRLEGEAAAAAAEILAMVGMDDFAAAEAELTVVDREALAAERAGLKVRLEDEDRRCHELFAAMRTAVDCVEALGGDARAAASEARRRTLLLEIEDGVFRYLRLRAGVAALEQALQIFKESHRGSMLERASEAFVTMSGGAYCGLRTQPAKDREILIAISSTGPSKEADQLSKGTRFQLYLSLRAAGYLEFAGVRAPPPFVADDIMETFDDFRAEEALKVFTGMAQVGQVVYLTHHRHLLPIARAVCPRVRVHELPHAGRSAA